MGNDKSIRVAVTGAFGFIGSYICDKLLSTGHSVLALGRNKGGISLKGAESIEGELLTLDFGRVLSWEPDVLVHQVVVPLDGRPAATVPAGPAVVGLGLQGDQVWVARTNGTLERWRLRAPVRTVAHLSATVTLRHELDGSVMWRATLPFSPQSKVAGSSQVITFIDTRRLPPFFGVAAQARAPGRRPAMA